MTANANQTSEAAPTTERPTEQNNSATERSVLTEQQFPRVPHFSRCLAEVSSHDAFPSLSDGYPPNPIRRFQGWPRARGNELAHFSPSSYGAPSQQFLRPDSCSYWRVCRGWASGGHWGSFPFAASFIVFLPLSICPSQTESCNVSFLSRSSLLSFEMDAPTDPTGHQGIIVGAANILTAAGTAALPLR